MKLFSLAGLGIIVAVLMAAAITRLGKPPERAGLTLLEQPDRIVFKWSGPVAPPMLETFEEAFQKFEDDPRRIVISLNSPGGMVEHGRQIVKLIHKASHTHQIDTMIEAGKSCASMCVPIYLVGAERMANPTAKFMFHEVSLRLKPEAERALRDLSRNAPGLNINGIRKAVIVRGTDELFDDDIGTRSVDARWLADMRAKIRGRDIWLTAKQLMEQGSGVVDKLM